MAITSLGTLGASGERLSDTSAVHTITTTSPSSGDLVVFVVGFDNTGTTDADHSEVSSVTDSGGNTYTKRGEFTNGQGAAGAGATVSVWTSVLTTGLTAASSTITATLATAVLSKAWAAWAFDIGAASVGLEGSVLTDVQDATDPASLAFSGLPSQEYLFVRGWAGESENLTFTPTASHTAFDVGRSSTTGTDITNIVTSGEWRILTGTGDTSDPTKGNATLTDADNVSVFMALEEVSGASDLVIQEALHAHAADNVVLTQVHSLVVADSLHAHVADNLTVTEGGTTLVIQDGAHGHTADNLVLTQVHTLAIAEALHGHTAEQLTLSGGHVLVIEDALHGHTADVPSFAVPVILTREGPTGGGPSSGTTLVLTR